MTCKHEWQLGEMDKLVSLIAPWFKEEAGLMQELAGKKTMLIPLSEYRKIQKALMELTNGN
jgi:hypothetical protein